MNKKFQKTGRITERIVSSPFLPKFYKLFLKVPESDKMLAKMKKYVQMVQKKVFWSEKNT